MWYLSVLARAGSRSVNTTYIPNRPKKPSSPHVVPSCSPALVLECHIGGRNPNKSGQLNWVVWALEVPEQVGHRRETSRSRIGRAHSFCYILPLQILVAREEGIEPTSLKFTNRPKGHGGRTYPRERKRAQRGMEGARRPKGIKAYPKAR